MMRLLPALTMLIAFGSGFAADPPKSVTDKKETQHAANGLAGETSPYLLQHAHNPVNWQPWGREAFEKAKKEKKLIFLSIGYSSCHWCHVMEKESFSNEEIAKILNDNFICIKVDREERPEVDEVYMNALQVMGARGGWPLSIFLTDDGKPIIGGTYWPREDRVVEIMNPKSKAIEKTTVNGFKSILNKIAGLKKDREAEMLKQADYFAEATQEVFARNSRRNVLVALDQSPIDDAFTEYKDGFDPKYGGIGRKSAEFDGTKFPTPSAWKFLLKYGREKKNEDAKKMVHFTLTKMAEGGIYDQLAGGFHRYSTERTWTVPHFEKMLYDNAQLIELYALAYRDKADPLYKQIVEQTIDFALRDMTSTDGLFYTAWDADSDGEEGRFYVWSEKQIDEAIGDRALSAIVKTRYGVTGKPNFETNDYVLRVTMDWPELAKRFSMDEKSVKEKVATASARLLTTRDKRAKPFRDTKVITAWNGQMIAGLALAGQVFERKDWIAAAEKAARRLREVAVNKDRLQRIVGLNADGKSIAKINACLDDYAFLIHGLLNLQHATANDEWKVEAGKLTAEVLQHLNDPTTGGFFMTAKDDDLLFTRVKDFYDSAQPAANNVMADNLLILSTITKDPKYAAEAERTLKQFVGNIKNSPTSAPILLGALMDYLKK